MKLKKVVEIREVTPGGKTFEVELGMHIYNDGTVAGYMEFTWKAEVSIGDAIAIARDYLNA